MKKMHKPFALLTLSVFVVALICAMIPSFDVAEVAEARQVYGDEWDVFDSFDYGLYFYSEDSDIPIKASDPACPYDPTKPTIIYSHGWKMDEGFEMREVLSLMHPSVSLDSDLDYFGEQYLADGYNVASFFWNQIADEAEGLWDSVKKVWTDESEYGMRYRVGNTRTAVDDPTNPKGSVASLLINEIKTYMSDFTGETLWLTGHSMGGELTLATAEGLLLEREQGNISEYLVPDRLSLFDPFFPNTTIKNATVNHTGKYYDQVCVSALSADAMMTCANAGMAIEVYATNSMAYGLFCTLQSEEMKREIAERFIDNAVWYFFPELQSDAEGFGYSHVRTRDIYFLSIYDEDQYANDGKVIANANQSIDTVRSLKGRTYYQTVIDSSMPRAASHLSNSEFTLCDGVEFMLLSNKVNLNTASFVPLNRHDTYIAQPVQTIDQPGQTTDQPSSSFPVWAIVVIAVVALAIIAAVASLIVKKKKSIDVNVTVVVKKEE